jgi:hypothetical protein
MKNLLITVAIVCAAIGTILTAAGNNSGGFFLIASIVCYAAFEIKDRK